MRIKKVFSCSSLCLPIAGLLVLAGCSAISNPLNREKPLKGERSVIVKDSDATSANVSAGKGGVSISSARLNADWSQPGGTPSNAPGNLSFSGSLKAVWTSSVGNIKPKRSRTASTPIVYQGGGFVLDTRGLITAVSLASGGKLWTASIAPLGEKSSVTGGGIAAGNGSIFAASAFGELVALNASTGTVQWTRELDEPARAAPSAADGIVVVITASNQVNAYKMADGSEAWTFRGIPEKAGLIRSGSAAIVSGSVIIPFSSGEIVALEASSGRVRWSDTLARSGKRFALSGLSDISGNPVVSGGSVFAGSISGRFVADTIGNGTRIWTKNYTAVDSPVVSGNSVFITDNLGLVLALDRDDGNIRWATQLPTEKREKWGGPLLAGGRIWVGSNQGRIAGINATTGSLEQTSGKGSSILTPPIAAGGKMLILTENGRLTAFQ